MGRQQQVQNSNVVSEHGRTLKKKKGVIEEIKVLAKWGEQQEKVSQVEKGKDAEE